MRTPKHSGFPSAALSLLIFFGTCGGAEVVKRPPERWYQSRIAAALGGKTEAQVQNGRVDVVTETHAIEVEFASKWKQSIGQALWYSLQTNKAAGIVLILEDETRDRAHAIRLGSVIDAHKLPIKVWLWPADFN